MIEVAEKFEHPAAGAILEEKYLKLKCEELLYRIFTLLVEKETLPASSVHINEIQAVYGQPPDIAGLAAGAGMSEPKLRRIFRQIFGKTVLTNISSCVLLKGHLSVSETGYTLNSLNLSHFFKGFEAYYHQSPSTLTLNNCYIVLFQSQGDGPAAKRRFFSKAFVNAYSETIGVCPFFFINNCQPKSKRGLMSR